MAAKHETRNLIIIGAAGRDFHDFNVFWKNRPDYRVVAFTAAQIPDIAGRVYPAQLAGPKYPKGIPIMAETELPELIRKHKVDECVMAYSDLAHEAVMHKAAIVNAAGADFRILGWRATMLESKKPVIAVCAVRTGCGKSQTTRKVSQYLKAMGLKVAVVRHPMPYGDLTKQICQRFACMDDMDLHKCTIEEREEYEPHISAGNVLFAGVDYERILRAAEAEADVILWDGGNNDMSFYRPDLLIVVTDPLRPGHELSYYPGETNLRMADIVVINKIDSAAKDKVDLVERNIKAANPRAVIVKAKSPVTVADRKAVRGKRVLAVEDGPTLTHGEMTFGAAHVAARACGAKKIVDPRPYAVGSIKSTFQKYTHITDILPAMGYGSKQMSELAQTIDATPCDLVIVGTPIDLTRLLSINKPSVRVTYELDEQGTALKRMVEKAVRSGCRPACCCSTC
ncbi:MAG: cyclic 2,3-diphosphoglycerate synthase [Elusimicrobiota bacterium]